MNFSGKYSSSHTKTRYEQPCPYSIFQILAFLLLEAVKIPHPNVSTFTQTGKICYIRVTNL